jgi:hypothetical protein
MPKPTQPIPPGTAPNAPRFVLSHERAAGDLKRFKLRGEALPAKHVLALSAAEAEAFYRATFKVAAGARVALTELPD